MKRRLGKDEMGLWRDLLVLKYDTLRGLRSEIDNRTECRWWRDLRNMWQKRK